MFVLPPAGVQVSVEIRPHLVVPSDLRRGVVPGSEG